MLIDPCPRPEAIASARLSLLGPLELCAASGEPQTIPYEKVGVLLALLALHTGPWEREALATLLWPDSELAQARANLRRALFDLREILSRLLSPGQLAETLTADKRQIELRDGPALSIDTRLFALAQLDAAGELPDSRLLALQRACALYRGPLLAQLRLDPTPGISAWLQPRREALHRQALRCLDQLAALLEQRAQGGQALEVSMQTLALDPWDEAALRRAMRLMQGQRRDESLRLYQDFAQRLQAELGLQPQEETQALAATLREQGQIQPQRSELLQRRRVVALVAEWRADTGTGLDEEQWPLLLAAALEQAARQLQAGGAWVQRAEGGELLAFFGHPEAQEHAVRHALDMTLELLAARSPLALRAGLHVGWVHTRQATGSPDTLGELSREARRLAWQAEPAQARLSAALQPLARRHHRLGPSAVDGSVALLGALPPHQRLAPLGRQAMVGRETELAQLCQDWETARQGLVAVWIQAEPGMGKTRLMQALRQVLRQAQPAPRLSLLHCLPEFSQTPLQPVLAVLRASLADLEPKAQAWDAEAQLGQLAQSLGLQTPLSALAALLQPSSADTAPELTLRREALGLLIQLVDAWGGGQRQLLMIEDLHWADPSTLELLSRYLQRERGPQRPALLVMSSREAPPPSLAPHVRRLELPALADDAMLQLLAQLQPQDGAPPARSDGPALLARAQGVPLFALELAHSLRTAPDERVPATLWDLLAARLDRLSPPLRRVAQGAAVLGSDWDISLLQATLADTAASQLEIDLFRLQSEGLLQARADRHWHFRHALQRDAAYESLSASERRQLHRRAADALLGPLSVRVADDPARLAHHLSQCGDPVAAHYWLQAGRRAAAQSAHQEACHALREGLALLDQDSAAPELVQRLRQPLLLQLGFSLLALEGYGSRSAHRLFEQARDAAAAEDSGARFQALWGLWLGTRSEAGEPPALQLAEALLELAQRSGDQAALVQARYAVGNNLVFAGRLQEAVQALELAAEAGERLPGTPLALRFGEHGGIAARAMSCWPLAWLGEREAAQQALQAALRQARSLGHAHTLCYVLCMGAVLHRHWRQPQAVLPLGQELAQLGERHGMALWQAVAAMVLGWAQAWQGDPAGVAPIEMAVAASAVAMPSTEATFLSFLCEALLRVERADEALPRLDRALQLAHERQELYLLPELWRLRAAGLRALGRDAAAADAALARAREHARAMGAALWLARCEASALPA